MTIQMSYTQARTQLADLCDTVANDREIVIIHRLGGEDVALIAADELADFIIRCCHILRLSEMALCAGKSELLD